MITCDCEVCIAAKVSRLFLGGPFSGLTMNRPKAVPQSTMSHLKRGNYVWSHHKKEDGDILHCCETKTLFFFTDMGNAYPRQQQQPSMFTQAYQQAPQNLMAPNLQLSHAWANSNPTLSMDTVTINPGASNLPRPVSRQQPPNRSYQHRVDHNSCENNALPQLSMRDLQCLDTGSQAPVMREPEQLFHQQNQREELRSETPNQAQNHLVSQNQGIQWSNFTTMGSVPNPFNGSGGGGGSQGVGSFPFLEGIEENDFLKNMAGAPQPCFQLKQESQISVGQESHTPLMQSPRESQGNTYTNLLPRPMSNGTNRDPMRPDGTAIKNLHSPYVNNGMTAEAHYATLEDWMNQNDWKLLKFFFLNSSSSKESRNFFTHAGPAMLSRPLLGLLPQWDQNDWQSVSLRQCFAEIQLVTDHLIG